MHRAFRTAQRGGVLLVASSWACSASFCSTQPAPSKSTKWAPATKFRVGVLGCTGAVGQRFVQYLEDHPWFDVVALAASEKSAGKRYDEATKWQPTSDVPEYAKATRVVRCVPEDMPDVDLVFSALDAGIAKDVEPAFRDAGVAVFSNASSFRMAPDVPLVVPPVNGGHLELVRSQPSFATSGGYIVTNANCSTTGLVIALKPLDDAFGIESVRVTTMQAVSGAGYPGVPSLDILDNLIPTIGGEEEKLQTEYRKIMGELVLRPGGGALSSPASSHSPTSSIAPAAFPLSAMVHRVHVRDGHSLAVAVKLRTPATPEDVAQVLASFRPRPSAVSGLPSAPPGGFIRVRTEADRPQPRLDRDEGRGFTTVVGRIRPDASGLDTVKLFVLSHNTVMGAAGSSILNAELAAATGLLAHRTSSSGSSHKGSPLAAVGPSEPE